MTMNRIEEMKLVAECMLGDNRRAFGVLVEAYQSQLRRFLLNLTLGNASLTDDIAQETFVKAYLNVRNFRGLSSFRTWLVRRAYNEFYSQMRSRHASAGEATDDMLGGECSHDDLATDAQITVNQALAQLTEVERTAVVLFYIEDQPVKKIATIMQMPEGTVKSHLHRAKEKMQKIINFDNC